MNEYAKGFALFLEDKISENNESVESVIKNLNHYAMAAEKAEKIRKIANSSDIDLATVYGEIDELGPFDTAVVLHLALKHLPIRDRPDQKVKPVWQAHVQQCVKDDLSIRNINCLLGYLDRESCHISDDEKAEIKKVSPKQLKAWAKEVEKKIEFKNGRDKINK